MRLYSHTGKIHVTGTDFIAETPNSMLHLYAPKSVTINPTTLTHSLLEKKISVTPSVGFVDMVRARMEDARKGNYLAAIFRTDLTDSAVGLAKSQHGLETVTGVWNVGVNGKNMYDLLQSGNLASYIAGQALKVGITFSQTKTRTTQQTEGAGLMAGFGLVLVETLGDFNQGVHMSALKAIIHADRYNIYAFAAHNTFKRNNFSVSVSYGPSGYSAGASMSNASSESTIHSDRIVIIKDLEVYANQMNIYGARVIANRLSGKVNKLSVISSVNKSSSRSSSVSASTDGTGSASYSKNFSQWLGVRTSLSAEQIDEFEVNSVTAAGNAMLLGGKHLTSMDAEWGTVRENTPVYNVDRGASISANFKALLPKNKQQKGKDDKPTPTDLMSSPFTASIHKNERRGYVGVDGLTTTNDEKYNVHFITPGFNRSEAAAERPADERIFRPEQFGEAFDSFTRGLSPSAPTWVADNSREEDMAVPRVKLWEYRAEEYAQDERPTLAKPVDSNSDRGLLPHANEEPSIRYVEKGWLGKTSPLDSRVLFNFHSESNNDVSSSNRIFSEKFEASPETIAGKFATGVSAGMALNAAIFKASSIRYVSPFIRGAGWLGAGAMVAEASSAAAEFERDNFMYTEDYEHIVSNPLITQKIKDQLFEKSLQRQVQARKEAEQLKDLGTRFKENPMVFGFSIGSLLTFEQLPGASLASNAFMNLRLRIPFKSIDKDRHLEYLNKVVKAPAAMEHIEISSAGAHGFENFSEARKMASLRANLGKDAIPYLAELGPHKGNVYVGMSSHDRSCLWRLDLNTRVPKGKDPIPHINWQYTDPKSGEVYYGAIEIEMSLDEYRQIINNFPRKLTFIGE